MAKDIIKCFIRGSKRNNRSLTVDQKKKMLQGVFFMENKKISKPFKIASMPKCQCQWNELNGVGIFPFV